MTKSIWPTRLAGLAVCICTALAVAPSDHYDSGIFKNPDYVVIGGGPAGFVLAEELSANPDVTVVLLEGGPNTEGVENVDTPGYGVLLEGTQYSWNFSSQPDPNIQGNAPTVAQGRGFGGGSAINYLGACRGAPSVFDEWADLSGDDGLRWPSFFNDFKATTRFTDVDLNYQTHINESAYDKGPIELTAPDDNLGFVLKLIKAWKNVLKLPWLDLNDGHGLGIATSTDVIRASNRTRVYALQAYGWAMDGRPNAQQVFNAQVTKINFTNKKATGVTYVNPLTGESSSINAKEIIVAAGALNTPKLLMLSGVGPAAHLKSLGIKVIADIAELGRNLFDHHIAFMEFSVTPSLETLWQYTENATYEAIAEKLYEANGKGPLGVPNGAAFAVSRVPDSVFEAVNDTFHPAQPADRGQLLYQYSSSTFQATTPNISIISPFVSLVQPEASGYLHLKSADYRDDPLIYSNYYGSAGELHRDLFETLSTDIPAGDKAAILYGYKELRKVMSDSAITPVLVKELFPGTNATSDEDLWTAISQSALSFHHPMGTVSLGKVVEGKTWRIKGLKGIRVIDSSTFPYPPTCHPMATVYAYAYHAAQLIKKQDKF